MRRLIFTIWTLSLAWTTVGRAEDKTVPPAQAIPLFLKIMSYDQSYTFDTGKTVDLYVPYDRGDASSYEQYRGTRDYFARNKELSIFGARVRFLPFTCDSSAQVLAQVDGSHYNVMLLTTLATDKLNRLLAEWRGQRIRTCTYDPVQITMGAAVTIRPTHDKNAVIVNLTEAAEEGSRFSAQLLRICEVIEENQ